MDKILKITKKYNLKIIEDCAHGFGIKYKDKYLGNFSDCAFFSLSKFLPTINGGILVCKKAIKADLKKYRLKPANLIKFARLCPYLATFSEKFRHQNTTLESKKFIPPRKASNYSLKMLNCYLDNFEEQISKRTELAKYFQEKLQNLGFYTSPGITYISALVPKNLNRDELFKKLRKKNIFCSRIWHKPIYKNLPNTSKASKQIISFPLQNWFKKGGLDKIIKKLKQVLFLLKAN
jgi:dTDP-4-amino-4,6-dideoxygalactose transaminase